MELAMWNSPYGIIIIAVLVLLLFGGSKIPEMMRGLGSGMREFKKGMNEDDELDREKREKEEQEKRIRARVEEEMRREDEARRQKGVS
jgi:sec-independent protein translocase protein TatA